jgi:enolase
MSVITSITYRKILNSHVRFTTEFIIQFDDGSIGIGASPQGETISIYEDKEINIDPDMIIAGMKNDGLLGINIDQPGFDQYLQSHIAHFGRNNSYGLSEAFFNAGHNGSTAFDIFKKAEKKYKPPYLCLNILNGGWHAYTNPVLSDFSEFMLVAKSVDISEVIEDHNEIQRVVREKQLQMMKTVVSGNPVNCFSTRDNRQVIDFLLNIVNNLGLANKYDLMIDASAGDLWNGNTYKMGITDGKEYDGEELQQYWMEIISQYKLRYLEDPFQEKDFANWQGITATSQQACYIIGDNLYSSDENRILEGAKKGYATGVVIKPNQAGTITSVSRSLEATLQSGQIAITSHRSISTESTFLSLLTCIFGAQYIKIGPLLSDYSSVVRLNEIIRLTEVYYDS